MLGTDPDTRHKLAEYVERLSRLRNILERDFHIEAITGEDKTVDVVVDIFNRVNSGGTKLSKGDLALARICAEWSDARPTMRRNLDRWRTRLSVHPRLAAAQRQRGRDRSCAVLRPRGRLSPRFPARAERACSTSTTSCSNWRRRLGLDHDRVLMGRYAVAGHRPAPAQRPVAVSPTVPRPTRPVLVRPRCIAWAVRRIDRDLPREGPRDRRQVGIDGVIPRSPRAEGQPGGRRAGLRRCRTRFAAYPLLYMLARVTGSGTSRPGRALGQDASAIQVHEIFPKQLLANAGYSRAEVNAIANFAFLTPSSAIGLSGLEPERYLDSLDARARQSQWIPEDPRLWRVENYREFVAARRELLAATAHEFLDELVAGNVPWRGRLEAIAVSPESDGSNARSAQITSLVEELVGSGAARPALDAEIADPETGRPLAVAEAFWPNGLQPGQGAPVVLELDPDEADLHRLAELGYEVFTSVDALRGYVQRRNEIASGEREDTGSVSSTSGEREVGDVEGGTALAADPRLVPGQRTGAPDQAESSFEQAVRETVRRSQDDLGYNPRYFVSIVSSVSAAGASRSAPGPNRHPQTARSYLLRSYFLLRRMRPSDVRQDPPGQALLRLRPEEGPACPRRAPRQLVGRRALPPRRPQRVP